MPLSHTPVYNLPYIDSNTPLHELDEATKGMAEGIETVFGNAQFPPGNPDLNDVLLRLNNLEKARPKILGGKNGAMPAGKIALTQTGLISVTTAANGTFNFAFPQAFPESCATIFFSPQSGTATIPVINGGNLTRTGGNAFINGITSATAVTVSYVAYGW